ncbi:HK97 family phage prohead protease [Paenibacillus sp. FSL K6-1230]
MIKAIYGMAMPFNSCYVDSPNKESEPFIVEKTNEESVFFDEMVGITLQHDYEKHFGTTNQNLTIKVTDNGVYFRLIPNTPLGLSVYKKVKRSALRHCSLSFIVPKRIRNIEIEDSKAPFLKAIGMDSDFIVKEYKKIIIYEICLTNGPANEETFCTTDPNDKRLKGIDWDGQPLPKERICNTDGLPYKESLKQCLESTNQLIEIMKGLIK